MPKPLLLHVCCAPCAAPSAELVIAERGGEPVLFYSNSNIYPREEYELRLEQVKRLAEIYGLRLIVDEYDHEAWLEAVKGWENEPEKGERCRHCFRFNLQRAAAAAARLGGYEFATTLTVSPHKDNATIFAAGAGLEGQVCYDFKRDNSTERSLELCRKYGFYRQNYCGCEFSRRDRDIRKAARKEQKKALKTRQS